MISRGVSSSNCHNDNLTHNGICSCHKPTSTDIFDVAGSDPTQSQQTMFLYWPWNPNCTYMCMVSWSPIYWPENQVASANRKLYYLQPYITYPLCPPRGSWNVVDLVLWSTKYLTPSPVYLISQPSGSGSSCINPWVRGSSHCVVRFLWFT